MSHKLVLLRHGQSLWNMENRFTGWADVGLSERGIEEARVAGQALLAENYRFDRALTSVLKRSIHTLWITLQELDQMWIPIQNDWQLNERHYGGLQGLNKSEMTQLHGAEQVHRWRRGYAIRPPIMDEKDLDSYRADPKYHSLETVPATESLEDTYKRVVHYWEDTIRPLITGGKRLLIVAHGNSLRALAKYLDNISDEDITSLNIPTGIPLVYRLDNDLKPIEHFYLADQSALDKAVSEVKHQSAARNH